MKKAEQIYKALGEGYGYNGSKEQALELINQILNEKSKVKTDSLGIELIDSKGFKISVMMNNFLAKDGEAILVLSDNDYKNYTNQLKNG